jgi:MFS family permease
MNEGFFWGPVADKYGRKNAFLMASSLICSSGFLSGVAPNYKTLVVFRAIVGFGVGGLTVPFDLLAEFLPSGDRGKFLMYIEYFWTFGSIFVAGVAWAALDKIGWRGLSLVTAVPVTLSSIAAIIYLPESPRWLLIKGRFTEAEKVLKDAALINGVDLGTINLYPSEDLTEEASWGQFDVKKELDDTTFKDLINTPTMRRISLPLWFIWTAFGFTYYGIILLVGRIYTTDTDALVQTCSFQYRPIFINSSAELVGVFIAALIIGILCI